MQIGSDLVNGSSLILVKYDTVAKVSAVFDLGVNYKDFSLLNTSFTDAGRTNLGNYKSWDLTSGNYATSLAKFDELTTSANVKWAVFAVDSVGTAAGARGIIQTFNPNSNSTPPSVSTGVLADQLDAVNAYINGANFANNKSVSTFAVATAELPGAAVAPATTTGTGNFIQLLASGEINSQGGTVSAGYGQTLSLYERLGSANPLTLSSFDIFDNSLGQSTFTLTEAGLLSYRSPGNDTVAPTVVSITMADRALAFGETSVVTILFSEAVTDFSNRDTPSAAITPPTLTAPVVSKISETNSQ
jgi:hypothetical protein